jgi:hypothetical protein
MEDISTAGGPVYLGLGPDSNLYYAVLNPGGDGEIRRVRYVEDPTARASADPTNGYPPLEVSFSSAGTSDPNEDLADLSYEWSFGDGVTSTNPSPTHTYALSGTFTAILTVTNSLGGFSADSVLITVGNLAPTATIIAPTADYAYDAGDTIWFSGQGEDYEDGVLPGDSLAWEVVLHHNEHVHPNVFNGTGTTGYFVDSDHGDKNWTELCLTVTDSGGLQDKACVELHPRTVIYTFDTLPTGLQLYYAGALYTAPFTVETIISAQRIVAAPPRQGELDFWSWSDGGDPSHAIVISSTPQMIVADYRQRVFLPLVVRNGVA